MDLRLTLCVFAAATACFTAPVLAQERSHVSNDIERRLVELIKLYETTYPGNASEKLPALVTAATTYRQIGMPAKAIPLYERILTIQIAMEKAPSVERVNTLSDLATVYAVTERYSDAVSTLTELVKLLRRYYPEDGAALYSAMNGLAACYQGMKRYSEAEVAFLNILALADTVFKAHKKSIAATYHNLGILYYQTKKFKESDAMLLKALALKKQLWGPSHPDVGLTLRSMANMYRLRGQLESAAKLKTEADAILGQDTDK